MSQTQETAGAQKNAMIRIGVKIKAMLRSFPMASLLLVPCIVLGCVDRTSILEEISNEQLTTLLFARINDPNNPLDMVVIDVRGADDYEQGFILKATNVPLESILDETGALVGNGTALTSLVVAKNIALIVYGNDGEDGLAFAQAARDLGYHEIYYYAGGIEDWESHDGFYVIKYEAFKQWHAQNIPFEDGETYLVDVLPGPWYDGTHEDYPEGHIPCAINIPIADWTDANFNPVDNAAAFTNTITNKDAKIVLYCGNTFCSKTPVGAQVASSLGYTNMFIYEGGWEEWLEMGEETIPGEEPCPDEMDTE